MRSDTRTYNASFAQDGFLGVRENRDDIRAVLAPRFELAEDLNRLAQKAFIENSGKLDGISTHSVVGLVLSLQPRMLSSFQGCILLAEQGMYAEMAPLSRVILEGAMWCGYLANQPDQALEDFKLATAQSEKTMHETAMANPRVRMQTQGLSRERLKELSKLRTNTTPNMKEIAKRANMEEAFFIWKVLSSKSHASFLTASHAWKMDGQGTVTGLEMGPDEIMTSYGLWHSIYVTYFSIQAFCNALKISEFKSEIADIGTRIDGLSRMKDSFSSS